MASRSDFLSATFHGLARAKASLKAVSVILILSCSRVTPGSAQTYRAARGSFRWVLSQHWLNGVEALFNTFDCACVGCSGMEECRRHHVGTHCNCLSARVCCPLCACQDILERFSFCSTRSCVIPRSAQIYMAASALASFLSQCRLHGIEALFRTCDCACVGGRMQEAPGRKTFKLPLCELCARVTRPP